jgi:GT2 family glycosyltransferase
MKKTLAIVVLTWNDFFNTTKCIKSIYPQLDDTTKLILVDNDSNEKFYSKTINWIKKRYKNDYLHLKKKSKFSNYKKKIIILRNNKNLGCGFGHNSGYEFAIRNNFEFVARVDNDMLVPRKFFVEILKNFNNKIIQGVSPKILYTHNPKHIWWMGTKIGNSLKTQTHMRDYPYGLKDNKKYSGIINTDAIAGCASIMRASRLKKVGLSDKDFFYGPEDIEFSRRIYNKPGSLIVDRNIKIYHAVTQSFKPQHSFRRKYFEHKYRLLLINKIGTYSDKIIGYSISIIKFFLYCVFSFKQKQRKKIRPVLKSLIDFFIFKRYGDFDRKINNH